MTIYNINFAIGLASSGVEYAQKYRNELLRSANIDSKFIFLELIQSENIRTYTANMGFKDEEIISMPYYFTDLKISQSKYTLDDVKNNINNKIIEEQNEDQIIKLILEGNGNYIRCFKSLLNRSTIDRTEIVINNKLIQKDYYTYTKAYTEYYAPDNEVAKLYARIFFNEDGSIAYRQLIDGEHSTYFIGNDILYSYQEFIAYFLKKLNLTKNDIIILDRETKVGQAVFNNKGEAKLGIVVHAEHYNENLTNEKYILWNNFYEYQFMNSDSVDFFITATDLQREVLQQQFKDYYSKYPKIYTIPVGSLTSLQFPNKRKRYSIITASRLANEKHVDWLTRAVIKAHKINSEITFDIYGEGQQKQLIQEIIAENNAYDYIQLKGHQNLEDVYKNYELFITGSTSEGFGLTLMEAVGSGLGMIGFDVRYGNTTFIYDNLNGYKLYMDKKRQNIDAYIDALAHAIVKYFEQDVSKFHEKSYEIAKRFLSSNVENKWVEMVEEVLYD